MEFEGPSDVGNFPGPPPDAPPRFQGCSIVEVTNGWVIERRVGPAIVIEKIEDRDNIGHLLAQLSVLLGDHA